jgi:hypothetical protein
MVYKQMQSPEYYLKLANEYQKSQVEVLNYFQMKKLQDAGMLEDYLKMIEIAREAKRKLEEEKQAREPRPLLPAENVIVKSVEPEEQEQKATETESAGPLRMIFSQRPNNQGEKYNFYDGSKMVLEINVNNKGEITSENKYNKLFELDPMYFGSQAAKDEFLNNITLKPKLKARRPPSSPRVEKQVRPSLRKSKTESRKSPSIKKAELKMMGLGHNNNQDLHQLNMLVGAKMAGNGNKNMVKDIKKLMKSMVKNKTLTKQQEQMILKRI